MSVLAALLTGLLPGILLASFIDAPMYSYLFVFLVSVLFFLSYALLKQRLYLLTALLFIALGIGLWRTDAMPKELPPTFVPLLQTKVVLEGVVTAQPDRREGSTRLTVAVTHEGERTKVIASASPHGKYMVGDRVQISGVFKLPEPFDSTGGRTFAYDDFLAKDGVFALMSPAHVEVTGRGKHPVFLLLRPLQSVRDGFIAALARAIPEPESALAAGLIAGGKQGLGEELLDVFTTAGLIHIVVLSGSNVMIVAEAVMRMAGVLPKRLAVLISGATIPLFVLAAGAGSAAVRAGAMALLGFWARSTGRTYQVVRALGIVLLVMLVHNPLLLVFDPGFQFSFVATLGLILLSPRMERWFIWMRNGFMRDIATATFAAQIAVLPLLLYQTGNLSIVSFGINLAVLPAIPIAMALGAISGGVALITPSLLEPLVMFIGLPAYVVLGYIIEAARFAADLPLASVVVPAFPFTLVIVSYVLLAFWIVKSAPQERGALPQP